MELIIKPATDEETIEALKNTIERLQQQILEFTRELHSSNKEIIELKEQIVKMKCCENCKYNSYWGDELHCNYGLKEAIQEDKLVECNNMDKWEIKE